MKFTPSSMARCKACTDSSSCAPIHPDPPMPHAPYPISETDRPVLPSGRYRTLPPAPATAPAAAKRFSSWAHLTGTPFIRFSYPRGDIDTYQAGSSPLAASGRPTGRSKGRDHGLVQAIQKHHADQQEADDARTPGRRADGAGRGQPGRDRAEDPPDRGRGPRRDQGLGLGGQPLLSVAQLAALVGENLRFDPHEARPRAPARPSTRPREGARLR